MERRRFLSLLGLGVAGVALDQAIPLGRVWSFPKEIVIPRLTEEELRVRYLKPATAQLFNEVDLKLEIGDIVSFPNFGGAIFIVTAFTESGYDVVTTSRAWERPHLLRMVPRECLNPTPAPRPAFRPSTN